MNIYRVLEDIKDGAATTSKYDSKVIKFKTPNIVMVFSNKQFLRKCAELNILLLIFKRYVDDINNLAKYIGPGYVYDGVRLTRDPDKEVIDRNRENDEVMMELLRDIGNSIHPSIQLTTDYPSNNSDKKMPILNLRVWIDGEDGNKNVVYEHYRKKISTKSTIHARSAMGLKQKRSMLTQELLTIMTNCSPRLDETIMKQHINEFMTRLQLSGYDNEFRYDIYNSAKKAHQKLLQESSDGTRPMHRPKEWKRTERKQEKELKKKTWYKRGGAESVVFIPCTPNEELKRKYETEIKKSGFNIKVIERSGSKIKDILHRKDPFKKEQCNRQNCFVCTSNGKGKRNCNKQNIKYTISCMEECGKKDIYQGETSYSAYTRGQEHIGKFNRRDSNSMLHNHCQNEHHGNIVRFRMDITGTFHQDPTLRQISEGVDIERTNTKRLMNTRSEWNSSQIPQFSVQRR